MIIEQKYVTLAWCIITPPVNVISEDTKVSYQVTRGIWGLFNKHDRVPFQNKLLHKRVSITTGIWGASVCTLHGSPYTNELCHERVTLF